MSEETTCYVSPEYFSQDDPFADFIVHEAAHIFHNCKRTIVGLRQTRRKEWLLDIEYRKRETFAYSCEAYARLIERGKKPVERRFWPSTDGRACNRLTSRRESPDRGSYRYAGSASDLHDAGPSRDLGMATNLHLGFVDSSPSGRMNCAG